MKICGSCEKKDVGLLRIHAGAVTWLSSPRLRVQFLRFLYSSVFQRFSSLGEKRAPLVSEDAPDDARASLSFLLRNHQIVLHGKNSSNAIGANACHILVGLTIYHAFQRYMPVIHNDPNRTI